MIAGQPGTGKTAIAMGEFTTQGNLAKLNIQSLDRGFLAE